MIFLSTIVDTFDELPHLTCCWVDEKDDDNSESDGQCEAFCEN